MTLFSAKDLTYFTEKNSRRMQALFPEILLRLVQESATWAESVFPAGDHIAKRGYDGEVNNPVKELSGLTAYVPQGKSVWELGTDKAVEKKFQDDLKKRTENPLGYVPEETVFIFVTPRHFPNKQTAISKYPSHKAWKEVKRYDVDDLRAWLNRCPKTELWLAGEMGVLPPEIQRLQDFYDSYTAIAPEKNKEGKTTLPPEFFLTGREANSQTLFQALGDANFSLKIEAETPQEAAAFVQAALFLSPLYGLSCLVVHKAEAAETLARKDSTPSKSLLLVLTDPKITETLCQALANKGWKVIWAVDQQNSVKHTTGNRLSLPWRKDIEQNLHKYFPKEGYQWVHRLSVQSGRSLNQLLSLLRNDATRQSEERERLKKLFPAILAGQFSPYDPNYPEERAILQMLACGKNWDELEEIFEAESTAARLDGKLLKIGEAEFYVRGHYVSLTALAPLFLSKHQDAFKKACKEIFESFAPCSKLLRKGLAQSLAIMGSLPEKLPNSEKMRQIAQKTVAELLKDKDLSWWNRSREFIPSFAEANPKAFLEEVETLLKTSPDLLKEVPEISDIKDIMGIYQRACFLKQNRLHKAYTPLLWSLQLLAWIPEFFNQTVQVLVKLIAAHPKKASDYRQTPNPPQSLENIFAPWNPQTSVSLEKRHSAIEKIVLPHSPEIGFNLLLSMLPRPGNYLFPSPQPLWRDLSQDKEAVHFPSDNGVLYKDYRQDIDFAAEKLLSLAETENHDERWAALLLRWEELFPEKNPYSFLEEWRLKALEKFKNRIQKQGADMKKCRTTLYNLLTKPRLFGDEKERPAWALSEKSIQELKAFEPFLEPKTLEEKFLWAFGKTSFLFEKPSKALRQEQNEITKEILKKLFPENILALASKLNTIADFCRTLADLDTAEARNIIGKLLKTEGLTGDNVTYGLFQAYPDPEKNEAYLSTLWQQAIMENWGAMAESRLLTQLPATLDLLAEIKKRPEKVQKYYWERLNPVSLPRALNLPPEVVFEGFRLALRPEAALKWILHTKNKEKINLNEIVNLLEEIPTETDTAIYLLRSKGLNDYDLSQLMDFLEENHLPNKKLAALELKYYKIFSSFSSQRGLKSAFYELSQKPEFFIKIVMAAYSNQGESIQLGKEKISSKTASRLLFDWINYQKPSRDFKDIVAGEFHEIDKAPALPGWEGTKFNPEKLKSWLKTVQDKLKNTKVEEITGSTTGEILAKNFTYLPNWDSFAHIFEDCATRTMENGLLCGLLNLRNVFSKSLYEGGEQEHALAESYLTKAEDLENKGCGKLAEIFRRIGEDYEKQAKEEDQRAERLDMSGVWNL